MNIDEHCSWNLIMHAYFFRCMQIFRVQTTPDSLTSFKCGHLQKNIYIYKYIFRSNSRGLAPLGPARPDKFINLASRGTNDFIFLDIILTADLGSAFITTEKLVYLTLAICHHKIIPSPSTQQKTETTTQLAFACVPFSWGMRLLGLITIPCLYR